MLSSMYSELNGEVRMPLHVVIYAVRMRIDLPARG